MELKNRSMSTDELLLKLPNIIGNNRFNGCYILESPTDQIGNLCLVKDKRDWKAAYMDGEAYVCLNPNNKKPPYNNAVSYGNTPNEALQRLYDWCVKYEFIK